MRKRKWGLAAAAAGLAVAIGAGVVMAQSEEDGTGIAFLDRVAEKLGVDRETLDTAIEGARSDEIDEAVANGDLTQEQADRLKERLDDLPPRDAAGHDGERQHQVEAKASDVRRDHGAPPASASAPIALRWLIASSRPTMMKLASTLDPP